MDAPPSTASTSEAASESADEPADAPAGTPLGDDAEIEEVLAAAPAPEAVDPTAERACERWGYACDPLDVPDDVLERTLAAMDTVSAAMDASDDAREQLQMKIIRPVIAADPSIAPKGGDDAIPKLVVKLHDGSVFKRPIG